MSSNVHVIIIQKATSLPEGLRQALKAKGFGTTIVDSEENALVAAKDHQNIVSLVFTGDEGSDIGATVGSLVELKQLHLNPIIIVGSDVDRYESFLNRHFILATTLTLPCTSSDMISAIAYVVKYVERIRRQREVPAKVEDSETTPGILKDFKAIPQAVFEKIEALGLMRKTVGGARYATTFKPQNSMDKNFLPTSQAAKVTIDEIILRLSEDQNSRYHRIGLLSSQIFTALGFTGAFLEDAKAAAFLYSFGFFTVGKSAAAAEYLSAEKMIMRKEVCSLVKDSLLSVKDLAASKSGEIVKSVGKLIGEEELPNDTPTSLAASAIATADAVDRIIFSRGVFQPVATYCVLSRLKREPVNFMHPMVLAILVKMLAEGVTSEASGIARNKRYRDMNQFMDAAASIDNAIIRKDEQAVAVGGLTPGMKLSRPLATYDGRKLLEEPMELDQDLIWRLWQLAAVRPLQKEVIISKSH